MVLRRMLGLKREEVAGEDYIMRSFINCTIRQILYGDQIEGMRWAGQGHVACTEGMINVYNIFVGKPEGKYHSENIGIDGKVTLKLILGKRWEGVDWMQLAQDIDQ
jgi:hypothetical protein